MKVAIIVGIICIVCAAIIGLKGNLAFKMEKIQKKAKRMGYNWTSEK